MLQLKIPVDTLSYAPEPVPNLALLTSQGNTWSEEGKGWVSSLELKMKVEMTGAS